MSITYWLHFRGNPSLSYKRIIVILLVVNCVCSYVIPATQTIYGYVNNIAVMYIIYTPASIEESIKLGY